MIGGERQRVGAVPRDIGIDVDVAEAAALVAGAACAIGRGQKRDVVAGEIARDRCCRGGIDREVGGVEQPVAGCPIGCRRIDADAVDRQRGARCFDHPAIAAMGAAAGGEGAVGAGAAVRPDGDRAAISCFDRVCAHSAGRVDRDIQRMRQRSAALDPTADLNGAAALCAGCVDQRADDGHIGRGEVDAAAFVRRRCRIDLAGGLERLGRCDRHCAAFGAAGRDDAAEIDLRALDRYGAGMGSVLAVRDQATADAYRSAGTAIDDDTAAARAHGVGAHRAGNVDGIAQHVLRGGGAEIDDAAIGFDTALVADQRAIGLDQLAELARRHSDRQEAVAREIERGLFAGTEADLAETRRDDAVIGDLTAEQGDEAAVGDIDAAVVDHPGRSAIAVEPVVSGEEVGILDVERRGGEGAGVDHAGSGDRDAVRIDQQYRARRVDGAGDARRRRPGDAVQRRRRGAGLIEIDGAAGADRERLPVDDRAVAALIDVQRARIRLNDRRAACAHRSAGRQLLGESRGCKHQQGGGGDRRAQQRAQARRDRPQSRFEQQCQSQTALCHTVLLSVVFCCSDAAVDGRMRSWWSETRRLWWGASA